MKIKALLHMDGPELWPEEFDEDGEKVGYGEAALARIRDGGAVSPEQWESLFQQNPIPAGGGLLKDEWWVRTPLEKFPLKKSAIITVDSAFKTGVKNDYTVFALWIKGVDGHAYLRDLLRIRAEVTEVQLQLHRFYRKWRTLRPKIYIEDKASGQTIIPAMRRTWLHRNERGEPVEYPALPILAYKIPRGMGNKEQALQARAEAVSQWPQAGLVHVLQDSVWLKDWLFEHSRVPKGTHDDMVMTTIMMLEIWYSHPQAQIPANHPINDADVNKITAETDLNKSTFLKKQKRRYEDRELDGWIARGYNPKTGEWNAQV